MEQRTAMEITTTRTLLHRQLETRIYSMDSQNKKEFPLKTWFFFQSFLSFRFLEPKFPFLNFPILEFLDFRISNLIFEPQDFPSPNSDLKGFLYRRWRWGILGIEQQDIFEFLGFRIRFSFKIDTNLEFLEQIWNRWTNKMGGNTLSPRTNENSQICTNSYRYTRYSRNWTLDRTPSLSLESF